MLIVEIDHNSNTINIANHIGGDHTPTLACASIEVNDTVAVKSVLIELFNIMPGVLEGVRLDEVDEDIKRTLDEW